MTGAAPTGTDPVIEAKGLNLVFQTADAPVHALKDVDLTVGQGDFVSFIGPSGRGKTTFLRVVADLEPPTSGTIAAWPTYPGASANSARCSIANISGSRYQPTGSCDGLAARSATRCGRSVMERVQRWVPRMRPRTRRNHLRWIAAASSPTSGGGWCGPTPSSTTP